MFGELKSEQKHKYYDIHLNKRDYTCTFEALYQNLICSDVPAIVNGSWMHELKELEIDITDVQDSAPIKILIGADVAGNLYTGQSKILKCGFVAIETLLGWTLMGKVPIHKKTQ